METEIKKLSEYIMLHPSDEAALYALRAFVCAYINSNGTHSITRSGTCSTKLYYETGRTYA